MISNPCEFEVLVLLVISDLGELGTRTELKIDPKKEQTVLAGMIVEILKNSGRISKLA